MRIKRAFSELSKILPYAAFIAACALFFGDVSQLKLTAYYLTVVVLSVLVVHVGRKFMYPTLSIEEHCRAALEGKNTASALVVGIFLFFQAFVSALVVLCVSGFRFMCLLLGVFLLTASPAQATISKNAQELLPVLAGVIDAQWRACPEPWVLAGKVEQESAWKMRAELKTTREYGFGLAQITIAYNPDGSERFNNFDQALRVTMMSKTITWAKRFDPGFQFTYAVLTDRSNFSTASKFFDDRESRMAGMLVSYNAGPGRLVQRKAEAIRRGIDPPRTWFNGLERIHPAGENRILYGRPLWVAINEYPSIIMHTRSPKYREPITELLRSM